MLPTFFVLGAARCGTTSLHYWLGQHPEIAMSAIKEPNHFVFRQGPDGPLPCIADDRRLLAKSVPDRTAYERLFPATGVRVAGDASPLYLYTRETPGLIAAAVPDARLIAVVREPVERAWSHFVYVNDGLGDEAPKAFAEAARDELPLGYEPYRTGTHFVRLSRYAEQLQRYLAVFPRDRLLVLPYADLVREPSAALRRICELLQVEPAFEFDTSVAYNPSTGAESPFGRIDRALRPAFPYLKRALPSAVAGRLAARRARLRAAHRSSHALEPTEDTRVRLTEHFRPDVEWLAREFGVTFGGSPPPAS
ncbi:MAG TPA: sulfotransferase [Mycobacteriales bacterium]|nr:sulfotransferase [Mycobacteriales bacterium]